MTKFCTTASGRTINLSILDFKDTQTIILIYLIKTINLSILDFKAQNYKFDIVTKKTINLSILDFKV